MESVGEETSTSAPRWFIDCVSAGTGTEDASDAADDASDQPREKDWPLTRILGLTLAAGGLYWALTYDPMARFPKEVHPSNPKWFGEVEEAANAHYSTAGRIVSVTPFGVVTHGAKIPVTGGFAVPTQSRSYGGSSHGFAGLDDLDELGGDGADLIDGDGEDF